MHRARRGAANARELLDQLRLAAPDVVLLDLALPDRDGLELIPDILALAPTTAIVVFSGYSSIAVRQTARQLGASDYVEKGASLQVLRDTIVAAGASREPGPVDTPQSISPN